MNLILKLPFMVSDIMPVHEHRIIRTYNQNINRNSGYNVLYDDAEFTSVIRERFTALLMDHFDNLDGSVGNTWAYVQNHVQHSNYWHNHKNTSTINAVFYWNIPSSGGGLEICVPEGEQITTHVVYPEMDTILVFPYWLYHRPQIQQSGETRISINIEYFSRTRPTHKHTGEIW